MNANPTPRRTFLALAAAVAIGGGAFGINWGARRKAQRGAAVLEQERLEAEAEAARRKVEAEAEARRVEEALKQLSREARTQLEAAERDDRLTMAQARAGLVAELDRLHADASAQVPGISSHLGGFNETVAATFLMAKDQVQGGSAAHDHVAMRIAPVTDGAVAMCQRTHAVLASFAHDIDAHSNAVAARMARAMEQLQREHPGAAPEYQAHLQTLFSALTAEQRKVAITVAMAPLEVGAVIAVVNLLRHLLGRFVQRAASTAAANGVLAAVDGPLLVGEIIAILVDVGFGIWTAWDLCNVCKNLPGQIAHHLQTSLDTQRTTVLAEFDRQAAEWLREAREKRFQVLKPLLAGR